MFFDMNSACKKIAKRLGKCLLVSLEQLFDKKLAPLFREIQEITVNQQEALQRVNEIQDSLVKVGTETANLVQTVASLNQTVADLKAAGSQIDPALEAAINAVAAKTKAIDDLVPDAEPTDPVPANLGGTATDPTTATDNGQGSTPAGQTTSDAPNP